MIDVSKLSKQYKVIKLGEHDINRQEYSKEKSLESLKFQGLTLVDDQGLENWTAGLKPNKERRFSDIILIWYSKSTQKIPIIYVSLGRQIECLGSKLRGIFHVVNMVL